MGPFTDTVTLEFKFKLSTGKRLIDTVVEAPSQYRIY